MKKNFEELNFFKAIENAEEKTQKTISSEISVSIGFVNTLIKRFLKKGAIKIKQAPYKRFIYYLTPKGFAQKSKLVNEYISDSLDFFRKTRKEFNLLFETNKAKSFIFYGVSDICEIAILSANYNKKKIAYIIDPNYKKKKFFGVRILKKIPEKNKYKIVITSYLNAQETFFELRKKIGNEDILTIDSLHISRVKPNFTPIKNE